MGKNAYTENPSVPTRSPQTTPQSYAPADHSFTLQSIMEMQKTLGELTQAVKTLTEQSKNNCTKLDDISHKIYAAQMTIKVVASVLGVIGSGALFLIWKIFDTVAPLVHLKPQP